MRLLEEEEVSDPSLPLGVVAEKYFRHAIEDPKMLRLLVWAGLEGADRGSGDIVAGKRLAGTMHLRQAAGEISPDLDVEATLLIMIGAVAAPIILPHLVQLIFGDAIEGSDFITRYGETLRKLFGRLSESTTDSAKV